MTATEGPGYPYEKVAATFRAAIEARDIPAGSMLPGVKVMAEAYGISVGTMHRAVTMLRDEGYLALEPARGFRVIFEAAELESGTADPLAAGATAPSSLAASPAGGSERKSGTRALLSLELRSGGEVLSRFMAEADTTDASDLRRLLVDAVLRAGGDVGELGRYELEIRAGGEHVGTFVATAAT
jgi:DNA-binding transcriptional MocR family regulator